MTRTTAPVPIAPPVNDMEGRFEPRVAGVDYGVLDGLVGYALRRAQILIYEDFQQSLAPWRITPPRFSALTLIARNPGMKQSELAHLLGIARSGVVMLTDGLEELGFVRRVASPTDRRAYQLELTEQGQHALVEIEAAVRAHDVRASSRLSGADKAELMRLLGALGQVRSDVD